MRQQKINYQKELEKTLEAIRREERVPTLLLHSCCGPCSSYVMEYLADFFRITVFYFNPNITDKEEYRKRAEEQRRLIERMNEKLKYPVSVLEGEYDAHTFFEMAKGMEHLPEGGERCFHCYAMRLERTAAEAKKRGMDYFTTTLSISPMKNAQKLNEIGGSMQETYGVSYLFRTLKRRTDTSAP